MARPKEFDREQVLDLAMDLFCEKGFEATSIQDLVERMGIGRASLYDTFGSKKDLISAALDCYVARMRERLMAALDRPGDPRTVIGDFFRGLVQHQQDGHIRSCLVAKSALMNGRDNAQLVERVCGFMDLAEQEFRRILERGRATGVLAADKDPRAVARFLVNVMQGLTVTVSARKTGTTMDDVVHITLSVLD